MNVEIEKIYKVAQRHKNKINLETLDPKNRIKWNLGSYKLLMFNKNLPYIIAEVGSNHLGSTKLCFDSIMQA